MGIDSKGAILKNFHVCHLSLAACLLPLLFMISYAYGHMPILFS